MSEKLNLSLPEPKLSKQAGSNFSTLLLVCLLLIAVLNLVMTFYHKVDSTTAAQALSRSSNFGSEERKDLALKLEQQGIRQGAIELWKEYLITADANEKEQANIWYRIGKLEQELGEYETALQAFYRAERIYKLPDIETDLNRRVQECLESAGKFAALRYELEERVGLDKNANSATDILAEIGEKKISKADLDRLVEEQIALQLTQLKGMVSEEQLLKQKEELHKRFSGSQERAQLLNQIVLEEILYRKAREDKLTEDPQVRVMLQDNERRLLAGQLMTKRMLDQIKITEGDLKTFYEVHKNDYTEQGQAQISQIVVADTSMADDLLKKLARGADFKELASQFSIDEETKANQGQLNIWIEESSMLPALGYSEELVKKILETKSGAMIDQAVKTDKGYHLVRVREKKAAESKPFEAVRAEVYRTLRSQKEVEVQQALLVELKEHYNVVIHMSALSSPASNASASQ